jgi:hypothetical protein
VGSNPTLAAFRNDHVKQDSGRGPSTERQIMGAIGVHEFIALDGGFEDPTWTFDYGFQPKMEDALDYGHA